MRRVGNPTEDPYTTKKAAIRFAVFFFAFSLDNPILMLYTVEDRCLTFKMVLNVFNGSHDIL